MSDTFLTLAAATFEVGVLLLVVGGVIGAGPARRKAVVILGALTPAMLAMVDLAYAQLTEPVQGNMAGAGWLMGFVPYVLLLLTGVATSLAVRPVNLYARYAVGLASTVIPLALLAP